METIRQMRLENLKRHDFADNLIIFRRSIIYQTKEFFQNSTLHGVRYIAETGRPTIEKFMWFCFTTIGTVTALIIIMSLWEKFQTNPTITGLDTDFHNQNVIFPTTVVCPVQAWDHNKTYNYVYNTLANYEESLTQRIVPFLESLPNFNFENIHKTVQLSLAMTVEIDERTLRQWAFQAI
uniref:Uncharacterized protein n=1 Tax=Glossina brevipalpis TaxID=37001 RepID=A0A1A9W176_9MUSC